MEIDRALTTRTASNRGIAKQYALSPAAVDRHRNEHLAERLVAAAEREAEADVTHALDVVAQLRQINTETLDVLRTARDVGNHGLALRAIDRVQRQIELQARLVDLISDAPTINMVITPEWITIRTVIIGALEDHPGARIAVAEALAAIEGGNRS